MRNKHPTTKEVLRQVTSLEAHINKLEIIPATDLYRSAVLLALLSKALTVSRATCALIDKSFNAEAFGLSRTLIEIFFYVRYISNKDTEKRAERYVNYSARVRVEWKDILEEHAPDTPAHLLNLDPEVIKKAEEFYSKANWTGHRGQIQFMALELDTVEVDAQDKPITSKFDYDALYFWTSHFVHATVDGIVGHATIRGEPFRVRAGMHMTEQFDRLSIFNILGFLGKISIHVFRAMNEEQPPALDRMYKMMQRCRAEKREE
jgi:hypothetical protein